MKIGFVGPITTNSLKEYLFLPDKYPNGFAGISVVNLVIDLLKLGHQVYIYTLNKEVKGPTVLEGPRLKIFFGEYRKRGCDRMIDFFRKETKFIKEFILEDKPVIVNAL